MVHRLLFVTGTRGEETAVLKQEMLALGGDAALAGSAGGSPAADNAVILMGTEKQLSALCKRLSTRPFNFPALAREIARTLDLLANPAKIWRFGVRTLDFTRRPGIMGILNVTPDSFSDGSRYLSVDHAVERALEMEAQGADIIDVGGESTRPNAAPVGEREELDRVIPVIDRLRGKLSIPISVDTYKAAVAREAIAAGAEIVNDISALTFDEGMAGVAATTDVGLVLMHSRGRPLDMQKNTAYGSLIGELTAFFHAVLESAAAAGLAAERIVLDPGIGFGKNMAGNLEIVRHLGEFTALGRPVLVGPSRKSFIGTILGRETDGRLHGTAAVVAVAVVNGASLLRVHDVREMRDVADMTAALCGQTASP
jgi:dihydropteroate synthase